MAHRLGGTGLRGQEEAPAKGGRVVVRHGEGGEGLLQTGQAAEAGGIKISRLKGPDGGSAWASGQCRACPHSEIDLLYCSS